MVIFILLFWKVVVSVRYICLVWLMVMLWLWIFVLIIVIVVLGCWNVLISGWLSMILMLLLVGIWCSLICVFCMSMFSV